MQLRAGEMDRMTLELAADPSAEAMTVAVARHVAALCRTPVSRATIALQDTLHTYFRLHPEIELSLKQGLVGSAIRTSAAVARDCVPEVRMGESQATPEIGVLHSIRFHISDHIRLIY